MVKNYPPDMTRKEIYITARNALEERERLMSLFALDDKAKEERKGKGKAREWEKSLGKEVK